VSEKRLKKEREKEKDGERRPEKIYIPTNT
jgi:hypothetical protein